MADFSEKFKNDGESTAKHEEDITTRGMASAGKVHFTAEEQAAVIRKLDLRLLPFVFLLYMLAVLDRSNLGNAKLAGLDKDIDLSGMRYNWLGTAFYIAYILFQWTTVGWKQFKPHKWCTFVVIGWGFVATIQAVAINYPALLVCRVFLAMFEACYGPGVPLYLTYFYPRDKVAFRHGVFISGAAMANAYGGALAYGIIHIKGSIEPWRILFLIEGLPTILVGVFAWWVLPDSILEARFLSEREKDIAKHFVAQNQRLDTGDKTHGLKLNEVWEGLKDPKSLIPALCYFGCNVSFASLPLFLPSIIKELGSFATGATANGLSAPPYLFCFFWIIAVCFASDHFGVRGPFCALSAGLSGVGFIILNTAEGAGPRYFGAFLAVLIFASVALLLAWVANIHNTESKRAGGYVLLSTVGQCGPLLGTNVFPSTNNFADFKKGLAISAAFSFLVCVLSITLSLWLIWENKQMEKQGIPAVEEFEETSADNVGDVVHKKNRYIW